MAKKNLKEENAELRRWMRESGVWIFWGVVATAVGWAFDTSYGQHDPLARLADFLLFCGGIAAVGYGFLRLFSK